MGNILSLRKDLDKRRKFIDSELKKLEKKLSKTAEPANPVFKPKPAPKPEPKPIIEQKSAVETYNYDRKPFRFPKFSISKRQLLAGSALIVLLIMFSLTISYVLTRTVTRDEFVSRVQGCESATYLGQVDGSLVKYSTNNCEVTKEITHVGESEPQEVRILFEGKKMTCKYRAGEFNYDDIDFFMNNIDACWGDLKEILLELQGYKLARERTV